MANVRGHSNFYKTIIAASCICAAFAVAAAAIMFFMPHQNVPQDETALIEATEFPQILE